MKDIFAIYNSEVGISPLFIECEIFDWYDGATSGIAKLFETNNYYLFNMVAWDIDSGVRIFSLVEIDSNWSADTKLSLSSSKWFNSLIKDYLSNYSGNTYLFKSKYINDLEYRLVKINTSDIKYYHTNEEVLEENEDFKKKWFDFFSIE